MRVLIADDDAEIRYLVGQVLRHACADVEIFEARDGAEALAVHADVAADAVLLDFRMPGGPDGLAVARHIRNGDSAQMIVLLTADASDLELQAQANEIDVRVWHKLDMVRLPEFLMEGRDSRRGRRR